MKNFKVLAMLALFTVPMVNVQAASDTAVAKQKVEAAIAINNTSDLDFGTAVQGDALKTVAPADAGAAAFTVTGEAGKAFQVQTIADITMVTAGGGTDKEIAVTAFAHNAPANITGGSVDFKVGATRAAIGPSQVAGDYVGTFTVNVIY